MGLDLTGIGSAFDFAKAAIDRIFPPKATEAEKLNAQIQLGELVSGREDKILETQKDVMVAELQQSDKFTKRARPAIIYTGLGVIVANEVIIPLFIYFLKIVAMFFSTTLPDPPTFDLPATFWVTWSGVASVYTVGRSVEKRGVANNLVSKIAGIITGNNK